MSVDPQHHGYARIIHLFDHFEHEGPHGIHLCLVLELLGPSLASLQKTYQKHQREIPAPVVKKATQQVLQGLDYLHRSCGIIHTGMLSETPTLIKDLQPSNILIELETLDSSIVSFINRQLAQVNEKPSIDEAGYEPLKPSPLTLKIPIGDELWGIRVKIADLGMGREENIQLAN
jgi:serine/threonine-protein kinase SRPK3